MGLKRLLVPESLYTALTEAIVAVAKRAKMGNVIDPSIRLGPSQNKLQLDRLHNTWQDVEKSVVKVLFRSEIPQDTAGYYFPVTLLDNPPADASFVINEIFGPLRSIPFEHFLAKPSEMFLILPLERVADSTHPMREHLDLPTAAMHHVLSELGHHTTRSIFSSITTSTSQP